MVRKRKKKDEKDSRQKEAREGGKGRVEEEENEGAYCCPRTSKSIIFLSIRAFQCDDLFSGAVPDLCDLLLENGFR